MPEVARADACETCGAQDIDETLDEVTLCNTCALALHRGFTIEEARLEVEDTARFWTQRFARAEGKPCTCDAGPESVEMVEKVGKGGAKRVGIIDFEVVHTDGCPRAPTPFDWPDVDEDARARVFGYRGREHLFYRLIGLLSDELYEREVLDGG